MVPREEKDAIESLNRCGGHMSSLCIVIPTSHAAKRGTASVFTKNRHVACVSPPGRQACAAQATVWGSERSSALSQLGGHG